MVKNIFRANCQNRYYAIDYKWITTTFCTRIPTILRIMLKNERRHHMSRLYIHNVNKLIDTLLSEDGYSYSQADDHGLVCDRWAGRSQRDQRMWNYTKLHPNWAVLNFLWKYYGLHTLPQVWYSIDKLKSAQPTWTGPVRTKFLKKS
jgi:hypothetical protein